MMHYFDIKRYSSRRWKIVGLKRIYRIFEYSFEFTFNSSEYFSLFLEVSDPFEEMVKFSVIKLTFMS